MMRLWRAYANALHVYPVRTASLTAGSLMTLGDAIAQTMIEKKDLTTFDLKRSCRFMFVGTFLAGPLFSKWYKWLAHSFGHTKYAAIKQVACDQLLFAPPFLACFLSGMEVLKGEGMDTIKEKLAKDYPDVMKTNYKIWPAVQSFNFTFVPVAYRVLVVNFVAVGWNTYLAWMSEKTHEHDEDTVVTSTEDNVMLEKTHAATATAATSL